jgi:stage II sporulation protein D
MSMTKALAFIILVLLPLTSAGQISIRIFARTRPVTVVFTPVKGEFLLNDGQVKDLKIMVNETVAITRLDDMIIYRTLSGVSSVADSLSIEPLSGDALFTLRAPARGEELKILDGSLKVKSYPGSLQVLNITSVESYLPGVVRAEAGKSGPAEYFRAQAVVARTYAYRNIDRHILDGYNLCDDTHCQVYPGIISDSIIIGSCRSTTGKVIIDRDSMLIVSAFHANCGGLTASSSDVWVAKYPYLTSIKDPWCGYSKSSTWQTSISLADWNAFLKTRKVEPGQEAVLFSPEGSQPTRAIGNTVAGIHISKDDVRQRFNLRSSFYTLTQSGDSITVAGRGYGHGVGLCQDGARAMAAGKMKYDQITGFYYPGTAVIDIKNARRPERP